MFEFSQEFFVHPCIAFFHLCLIFCTVVWSISELGGAWSFFPSLRIMNSTIHGYCSQGCPWPSWPQQFFFPVSMRSSRMSPFLGSLVICIRKLLSMCSRNLLDRLCPALLHFSRLWGCWKPSWEPECANVVVPPIVWGRPASGPAVFVFLVRQSVADTHHSVTPSSQLAQPVSQGSAPCSPAALSQTGQLARPLSFPKCLSPSVEHSSPVISSYF